MNDPKRLALLILVLSLARACPAWCQAPLGLLGHWSMNAGRSHFAEDVTGPAPGAAELDITKDDGAVLAWTLVERDGDSVAASEFGDMSIGGLPGKIVVDGAFAPVTVRRTGLHSVELISNLGGGAAQAIELKRASGAVLVLDETLTSPKGKAAKQHLEFDRAPG